LDDYYVSIKS